jgi:hypothetical protein
MLPTGDCAEGGSPQGLLHLVPGIGLHWYVHSTKTRVKYELTLPADSSSSSSSDSSDSSDGVVAPTGAAAENFDLRSSTGIQDASSGNDSSSSSGGNGGSSSSSSSRQGRVIPGEGWAHVEKNWGGRWVVAHGHFSNKWKFRSLACPGVEARLMYMS